MLRHRVAGAESGRERQSDVLRRAQQLGLTAEYVGPGVKIGGKTWAVSHADAYLRGYFDGCRAGVPLGVGSAAARDLAPRSTIRQ